MKNTLNPKFFTFDPKVRGLPFRGPHDEPVSIKQVLEAEQRLESSLNPAGGFKKK